MSYKFVPFSAVMIKYGNYSTNCNFIKKKQFPRTPFSKAEHSPRLNTELHTGCSRLNLKRTERMKCKIIGFPRFAPSAISIAIKINNTLSIKLCLPLLCSISTNQL
jgi:hypothetical protein